VTSSGAVVQTINLNTLPWSASAPVYVPQQSASYAVLVGGTPYTGSPINAYGGNNNNNNNNNNVQTVTYGSLAVSFILTASNRSGTLHTGDGIITSKSVEIDIEILFFPYISKTNGVRLTEVFVSSTVNQPIDVDVAWHHFSRTSVGYTNYDAGYSGVYFDVATRAYCNGTSQDISVTDFTATYNSLQNYKLYAIQLTAMAKLGRNLNYFGKQILFPAGMANITFSQTLGVGAGPILEELPDDFEDNVTSPLDPSASTILGLSKGAFTGIMVGSVVGLVLLTIGFIFAYRFVKRTKGESLPINESTTSNPKDQTESTSLVPPEAQQVKYQALT